MKVIFSKKGFDSENGGIPSPILPDGRMRSLPIPDDASGIAFSDISWDGFNLGALVEKLTKGNVLKENAAHLDPDVDPTALPRKKGWKGIFGPFGPAQTHLENNGVSVGDLFLFFGWFRQAAWVNGGARLVPGNPDLHVIFGWLQVGCIKEIDQFTPSERRWAEYHPHFHPDRGGVGTIYLGSETLRLRGVKTGLPGYGVFPQFDPVLCLTEPGKSRSHWRLPRWMYPAGRQSALSCHSDLSRWERDREYAHLRTVGRGQEFVLDCDYYPEATEWFDGIFACR